MTTYKHKDMKPKQSGDIKKAPAEPYSEKKMRGNNYSEIQSKIARSDAKKIERMSKKY